MSSQGNNVKNDYLTVSLFRFSLTILLLQKLATPGETTLIYRFGMYLYLFAVKLSELNWIRKKWLLCSQSCLRNIYIHVWLVNNHEKL